MVDGGFRIEEAKTLSSSDVADIGRLVGQLSSSPREITAEVLSPILTDDRSHLLVARKAPGAEILGMLTLVIFNIPTGVRAWIEDVVVDESTRGVGLGKALTLHAIEVAKSKGAVSVDLTSRPSRVSANAMYQRLGFKLRETNVYRYG
ncbi:Ribosomal protein S18 acetylase RimI [Ferrithrix thermotolerans DSM 19514]|jgi:ribosomal protein S18 acetylase RimI-like enzyme|uniref:Ribosomal protein S18 acetylase RimI n=1 Tax=Ferrithrix thermotolerans DSM 19514 TaxID=1121881 RepID=A0A1M4XQJ0_9ACTN|nr:Ribosomal protein S18 acetylase RimI [Ferrithrix thermotolerans DSM 19514]